MKTNNFSKQSQLDIQSIQTREDRIEDEMVQREHFKYMNKKYIDNMSQN